MKKPSAKYECESCLGCGFRIHLEDGRSFNADAARDLGIKGERRPCPSCSEQDQQAIGGQE